MDGGDRRLLHVADKNVMAQSTIRRARTMEGNRFRTFFFFFFFDAECLCEKRFPASNKVF